MNEKERTLITSDDLVTDIILSDELPRMRQHLRVMADAYLLSEDEPHYRHNVFSTYMNLDNFLEKAELLRRKKDRAGIR